MTDLIAGLIIFRRYTEAMDIWRQTATLEWGPGFSVGNDLLDSQHRELLRICRLAELSIDDTSEVGAELFHVVLNDLCRYADVHFRTEEAILERIGYPNIEEQRVEHQNYLDEVSDFLFKATLGRLDRLGLARFLTGWWMHHILDSDMHYAPFMQGAAESDPD